MPVSKKPYKGRESGFINRLLGQPGINDGWVYGGCLHVLTLLPVSLRGKVAQPSRHGGVVARRSPRLRVRDETDVVRLTNIDPPLRAAVCYSLQSKETPFTRPCSIVVGNQSGHQTSHVCTEEVEAVKQRQSLMSLTTVVPSCRVLWHVARRAMLRRNCRRLSTSTPLWPG